ncbi:hypothetical protein Tco_1075548 [Tanacetum coccineum]
MYIDPTPTANEVHVATKIQGKPLVLPWGRTPRLDSGVRSGALVGQGSALIACLRIRTLFRRRPTEALGRGPIVRVQPRPRSLVCPLYVIKSPQSSRFITCDTLMHVVWLARLCSVARLCFRDRWLFCDLDYQVRVR